MSASASSPWRRHEPAALAEPRLPHPDTPVVPGVSCFEDDVWDLSVLCPRPTTRWIRLHFNHCPDALRADLRHFFYLLLTIDTPLEQLDRPASARKRLAPSTLKTLFEDLKPFFSWFEARGLRTLAELTEQDLHEYAGHVVAAPVGQNPRTRRLFALSRLWLMAPYMRPAARL